MGNRQHHMATGWHRNPGLLQSSSLFPAEPRQRSRIGERKVAAPHLVAVKGVEFEVFAGVYDTSADTELMADAVKVRSTDAFLEVGCGCGAVSLLLARQCRRGVGVDVNPLAVENAVHNRNRLGVGNVEFGVADVFSGVEGRFDVVLCNPPYNLHDAADAVERMFWDPGDEMKRRFFAEVRKYMARDGRVYFGWADFQDLKGIWPVQLARSEGLRFVRYFKRSSRSGLHRFFVIEFGSG